MIDPEVPISKAIDRFQDENGELALIEDGNAVGLLTVTDAFEEVIDGLRDPLDVDATG